jgi:hypothetical protein
MATILLCGVDLLIRSKLEALVPEHRFETSDGVDPPDLVIADVARLDPDDASTASRTCPFWGSPTTQTRPGCAALTQPASTR